MYFGTKSYLKSNRYHTAKHALRLNSIESCSQQGNPIVWGPALTKTQKSWVYLSNITLQHRVLPPARHISIGSCCQPDPTTFGLLGHPIQCYLVQFDIKTQFYWIRLCSQTKGYFGSSLAVKPKTLNIFSIFFIFFYFSNFFVND